MVHNTRSQRAQLIDWSWLSLETVFLLGQENLPKPCDFYLSRFPVAFVQTWVPQNMGCLLLEPHFPSQNEQKLRAYIFKQPHLGMTNSKLQGPNDHGFWYFVYIYIYINVYNVIIMYVYKYTSILGCTNCDP